jgi:SAM-dependent methyltransferase
MIAGEGWANTFLRRTLRSPRWRFAHPFIKPFVADGGHWIRHIVETATEEAVSSLDPQRLSVLEISGARWRRDGLFRAYRSVEYPDFDVCRDRLEEQFDLIIAEQVFEHLLWPLRAGRNVYSMLKPGGTFLVAAPFLVKVHAYPVDCSRWTETGLRHLLQECGFDNDGIRTASWGNRACVVANLNDWALYVPWKHSLENEPDFPLMVWALARKRDAGS